jgi:ribosomal protein L37AE/L43A
VAVSVNEGRWSTVVYWHRVGFVDLPLCPECDAVLLAHASQPMRWKCPACALDITESPYCRMTQEAQS